MKTRVIQDEPEDDHQARTADPRSDEELCQFPDDQSDQSAEVTS